MVSIEKELQRLQHIWASHNKDDRGISRNRHPPKHHGKKPVKTLKKK